MACADAVHPARDGSSFSTLRLLARSYGNGERFEPSAIDCASGWEEPWHLACAGGSVAGVRIRHRRLPDAALHACGSICFYNDNDNNDNVIPMQPYASAGG